jgi:NAD(P)H-dependent FMN reductase
MQPASWIHKLAQERTDMEVELIDLGLVNLPFLDEPESPMKRHYTKEYTKAWSEKIDGADGFIFVTPEYNHSFSPVLKNAIDYLFHEWHYKPVAFVSYGSLAGGSRAVEHLRGVSAELRMYDLREQIMLPNYWEHLNENGEYEFTEQHVKSADELLSAVHFWAEALKPHRQKLQGS